MRQPSSIVAAAALVLACARGSDPTGPAKPGTGTTMSARIDGEAWNATSITTESAPPSLLVVRGQNVDGTLVIVIPLAEGLGTQTVGSTTPVAAGLVIGSQSWAASRTQGGAGSVTLTTFAPGHVAGTFAFTVAHEGSSPAARQVTSGRFDVRF